MDRKIVYVEWLDAVGCAEGWDSSLGLEGIDGKIQSIGWLLDENDEFILVAGHYAKDQAQGAIAIPWGMITKYYDVEWV